MADRREGCGHPECARAPAPDGIRRARRPLHPVDAFRRRECRSRACCGAGARAGPQLLAHRACGTGRLPRRRRRLFRGGARSARAGASLDRHPGLGYRQPDAPRARRRERRPARTAWRLPERGRRAPARTARLRAVVGLRHALRDGARVAADLQARLAHAPPPVVSARRPAPDRRVAPPEGHRRRRCAGLRQRLRSHALPLGYERACPRRCAPRRSPRRAVCPRFTMSA